MAEVKEGMGSSPQGAKVYAAINAVQKALSHTGIAKDRTNTQGAGYKFRGIDDVYNAIAPLLAEHGLCIIPRFVSRVCEERVSKSGGALFYVTVEAEFDFVCAADGSQHVARTFGEAMDSGDKATNKAMSAAYKYAAFQTFAIPTEGNNDADAQTHEAASRRTQWLIERKAEIAGAKTVGELKKIMDAAVAMTVENNDPEAEAELREAALAKAAKAKPAQHEAAT
jgi:hypothetical protein